MVGLRNIEDLESDEPIEQYSEEELNRLNSSPSQHTYSPQWSPTNFSYIFPPSPPSFPPYPLASLPQPSSSNSLVCHVRASLYTDIQPLNEQHEDMVNLGFYVQLTIHDRGGGVLDVIPSGKLVTINGLEQLRENIGESQVKYLAVLMEEKVRSRNDVLDRLAISQDSNLMFLQRTPEYEDMVDHLVRHTVRVRQYRMEYRGGGLEVIGDASTMNGVEIQGLSATLEPSLIFQTTNSRTVWLGRRGQWMYEFHYRWNWLNIGTFKVAEGASLASELVMRYKGGKNDLVAFPRLFLNENRSEPPPPRLALTSQEENRNEDFGLGCSEAAGNDEVEAVGNIGSDRTGDDCVMTDQLNSECLGKKKTKEKNPVGERRNKKTNGVRIAIPLEHILQNKGMRSKDAAKHLKEAVGKWSGGRNKKNAISLEDILRCKEMPQKVAAKYLEVSLSTLKRACRRHDIPIWPPYGEHYQSRPNEYPAIVDKEQIPQLKSDMLLPSNQVSTTTGTESVTMKARFGKHTIKFQLSWPFGTEELKQQVKKRLELELGTYYINYKDEDNDDILIGCDEDLQDHISRSSIPGTNSIEVFLQPK